MDRIQIHSVTSGKDTKGWIHTHGMNQHSLPELEMRNVPGFLAESAASLLRVVSDYMIDSGTEVQLGEVMATTDRTMFRLVKAEPIPGEEGHYETERWQIVEVDIPCDDCRRAAAKFN